MTTNPRADVQTLLTEVENLRSDLENRRAGSPYPWDPSPLAEFNQLLERVQALMSGTPLQLPAPLQASPPGQSLWRTPTDEALLALERLRLVLGSLSEPTPPGPH